MALNVVISFDSAGNPIPNLPGVTFVLFKTGPAGSLDSAQLPALPRLFLSSCPVLALSLCPRHNLIVKFVQLSNKY